MLQEKLDYFFKNNGNNKVFSTSDETLFTEKQNADTHGRTLEDDQVLEHLRPGVKKSENSEEKTIEVDNAGLQAKAQDVAKQQAKDAAKKPTPAELKILKDKAVAEHTELFGTAPDVKLSGAKIQELNDAKKAELAKAQENA